MPTRPPAPVPARGSDDPAAQLDGARAEAAALVEEARAEAGEIREEARAEGYRAGCERAMAEVAGALAALDQARSTLDEHRAQLREQAGEEAMMLAVEIAAKLLRAELAIDPARVVEVVRAAIRRASDRSELIVLVHPDDLGTCRAAAPEIIETMGGIGSLQIVDEPRIDPGSCVVRGPGGDVDGTFQTQLARVLEALMAPPDPALAADAGGAEP